MKLVLFEKIVLAIDASLVLILANLWLKEFENALKREFPELTTPAKNCKELCPNATKNYLHVRRGRMRGTIELVSR